MANRSHPSKTDIKQLIPGETLVDLYRAPDKKDSSGWRGPCQLLDVSAPSNTAIVKYQSIPYIVPLRHIRVHRAALFSYFVENPAVDPYILPLAGS